MDMFLRRIWLIFLLIHFVTIAFSQSYIPSISTFTTDNGLSSNEVLSIHKDQRGFMWVGTQYGLNRFDGHEFKVFTQENTPNLDFDIINNIMEDDKGNLWLVKSKEKYQHIFNTIAVNLFNIYSGKIQTLEEYFGSDLPFKVEDVTFIKQLSDKSIFIRCNKIQKTFRYDFKKGFQLIPFPTEFLQVADVLLKGDQFLISASDLGKNDFIIFEISKDGKIINRGNGGIPWAINDNEHTYAMETWGYYNLKAFEHFSPQWDALNRELNYSKTSIYQTEFNTSQNLFWLREHNRISVVTPDNRIVFSIPNHGEDYEKSPFFFDGTTTWFSNKKEGLSAVTIEPNHFQTYQFFENSIENSMRGIIKDVEGSLWFSSIHGKGKMDSKNQVLIINKEDGFSNFLNDNQGNIWENSNGSLVKHDIKNNTITKFPKSFPNYAWSFFEAENQEIWIGAGYYNFFAFNPKTGEYSQKGKFPIDERSLFDIYHFQKRDKETVWICSNQGLHIVNLEGEVQATYNDEQIGEFYFPAKDFRHMYQEGNEIWIATGDAGLFQINKINSNKNGEMSTHPIGKLKIEKQYTSTTGLSSNSLHAVYADDFDYLWISSDHGLMQLDRRDGQIFKYFKTNGIQHNEFNRISHFQDKDGQLFFGGLYGITSFHPKDFSKRREQSELPKLEIADFQQFSGKEEVFKNLTANLLKTNHIILNPSDRIFKIKLGLLDFRNTTTVKTGGKNNVYQYRIKGLYDWQSTQSNELIISGLSYGRHTLEIKAQNGNRQFASNDLIIDIQALRPFYLQWWFVSMLLGGLGFVIFLVLKRRTQQMVEQQEALQLKELDKMKSRFFANISHELRTPLTLIGLPLEHLIKNFDQFPKEDAMTYLKSANSNKENLKRLIDEILDLSKLEAGKLELEKKDIPLQYFIKKVVSVFETSAMTKGIQFQYLSIIDERVIVQLDSSKLEVVINNLLSNALKFTPKGGEIIIKSQWTKKQELIIEITDTGRGIHPDDLPNIFERYFQTNQKNQKLEGGSGIGLAFCKELLELMNGQIQVFSEFGKGSTFEIQVPLEIVNDAERVIAAQKKSEDISSSNTFTSFPKKENNTFSKDKSTILIVEDHDELRQHLENILSNSYNIMTASNGQEAINVLSESSHLPSLIISDVMMPEMDGFTFLEKIKAHDDYCGIPFILLTARTEIQDKLHALRIGVDAYLTKPFEIEELLLKVKNLLVNLQNRNVEVEIEDLKSNEIPSASQPNIETVKVRNEDLEWLRQVETIAIREIRSTIYSVDDLAKELLMSRSMTYRKIKRITGLTPKKYLNTIRLQRAKNILETQHVETLKEVCLAIGFENSTHFSKLFENEFGKRPHVYLSKSQF